MQFGPDNLKKIAAIEDERRIKEVVHKQMDKEKLNGGKDGHLKILDNTVFSRNPAEQQKQVRMQIEDLINHSKKAKEFLDNNKEHTK